jgi:hypothetical protein
VNMPRISHKKATTLSCVLLDADHVARIAEAVAETLALELSGSGSSSCSVAAAVARMLPLVNCPLQPNDMLQRCAALHLVPSPSDGSGGAVCVASLAAACTILWSVMLEGVGDIVQRGVLKIIADYGFAHTAERAGSLVLQGAALRGEEAASCAGLTASIDLLLADANGSRLMAAHRDRVIELLLAAARRVLYCTGSSDLRVEVSSAGEATRRAAPQPF